VPVNARFGGVGSLFGRLVQPAIDVGSRLSQGENPVNAIVSAAGGELGAMGAGAAAARLAPGNPLIKGIAGMVGYAAASPATNAGINWLSKNATLSDRGALNGPYSHAIGSIPPKDKTGESYRDQELRLSAAARAAGGPSAGGGIGGGNMASYVPNPQSSPAAERAYQQQLSSTAQQVAQDPQLDAWSKQRALDVASKDYSKSEDMGMKIWAERHKDLAAKVKPGQAGYDTIQQVLHGTMQQPMTQNLYTNSPTFPSVENYANQQPNAIVYSSGIMPTRAIDNPKYGAYNSTSTQAFNLSFPIIPTTTIGVNGIPTNSAPMGAALYTPNSSTEAYGTYSGPPVKLPISQTGFGAPGYSAITASAMLPTVNPNDVSKAFSPGSINPALRAQFYAMHTAN
jgi:hypothetical protein